MIYGIAELPEHPLVSRLERTGEPTDAVPRFPVCPLCGADTDTYYVDTDGLVLGCPDCVSREDAWELCVW